MYATYMSRTNPDIDDEACPEPASVDEARAMRGSGWEGDLDAMRSGRLPPKDAP